ncbi:hypothetical protein LCGC14_1393510 [marine sediment metagenome]|uniref:Uncharacterized protein n=1 Tax=marine sediment metagenome TaxID=412755 RepID=A0A0F8W9B5_9ZZZZ
MAQHDPVEDALNERKRRARFVEAGGAFSSPVNPEALDITRQFLGGKQQVRRRLPPQASPVAGQRAFGQQGARQRPGGGGLVTPGPTQPDPAQPLSDRFFDLQGPVGFSKTPQGRAILQRILGLRGKR